MYHNSYFTELCSFGSSLQKVSIGSSNDEMSINTKQLWNPILMSVEFKEMYSGNKFC